MIVNAIIERATITNGERGILESWLFVDYGGSGQGFGGFALYLPKSFKHATIAGDFAGHWIYRVLAVAGTDDWAKLPGRTIRVRKPDEFGRIEAIGHIIRDDWFDPAADFARMRLPVNESAQRLEVPK